MELTFQVASFTPSDREAGAAAAGGAGVGIVDLEGGADQVVHEIELCAFEKVERHGIDKHRCAIALDDEIFVKTGVVEGGIVLKPLTPAARNPHPLHNG